MDLGVPVTMFFRKKNRIIETDLPSTPPQELLRLNPLESLKKKVEEANLTFPAKDAVRNELRKLEKTDPALPDYTIGLNYIDFVLSLPWQKSTPDRFDLLSVEQILQKTHYSLREVKERVLDFLASKVLHQLNHSHILVVDDEEITRSNLKYALSKDGYNVLTAANGSEALDILNKYRIDVLISDLKMEQINGEQLLEEVKRVSPSTRFIMITGYATVDSAVSILKKGAVHYLRKPVDLNELRKCVRRALDYSSAYIARGTVLCFAGPPGTGKTSIGQTIAQAMGRKFICFSMAGLRDEAELKGHRRTYIGAMPGRIISEIKKAGVNNPVIMLDEVDKLGTDFRGYASAVLLEILDPAQNHNFIDFFLDVPFDLSKVFFIATANEIERLPRPLLDRMEVIYFPSYSEEEKIAIAKHHLVPRQLKECGLAIGDVMFQEDALLEVIRSYTQEAGLRELERQIAKICRKLARKKLRREENSFHIDKEEVYRLLGPKRIHRHLLKPKQRVGVARGLVWSEFGGEVILVEACRMQGNKQLLLTGSLGRVLRESARIALSFIRTNASQLKLAPDFFANSDIHVHIPAGSVPKDGPSAGLTIVMALISLLADIPIFSDVAISGEITLSGEVMAVSGLRDKLLAAKRAGINKVILPLANKENVLYMSDDVKKGLEIVFVDEILDAVPYVLSR